jgi:DNA polymerase-3 subunit epsilon
MNDIAQAVQTARMWLSADPLFLDTETTGLDKSAEICEIAILDAAGKVLMDTLVRPVGSISLEASRIHGITNSMTANTPTFAEILLQIEKVVKDRTVVIYNLDYDWRLLKQSAKVHKIKKLNIDESKWHCAMKAYARFFGQWNDYRCDYKWHKLESAAKHCRLKLPKDLHRARADAELTRQVVIYMAQRT